MVERPGILRVDLPDAATPRLSGVLADLASPGPSVQERLAALLQASCHLPPEVVTTVLEFRAGVGVPGTLLLTGMPVDADLPPTPTGDDGRTAEAGPVSQRALLMVAVLLGEPVAYQGEKDGALVQDVYPVPELASVPANEGSGTELGFHTELTFSRHAPERRLHETCPDFVLLMGLRCPPERAATTVTVEARAVCGRLDARQLAQLREPQFELRAPHSFTRDGGPRPWSGPVALLRGSADAPSLAFDAACGVRALTPEGDAALEALLVACNDPAIQTGVQLRAGDLLVIDNNRCAHARSPFPARFDGRDRWLRRAYVRRSIWDLTFAAAASSRVLA